MTADDRYREAVRAAADRIDLSPAQLAQIAILFRSADPVARLSAAVTLRPDHPAGIARQVEQGVTGHG